MFLRIRISNESFQSRSLIFEPPRDARSPGPQKFAAQVTLQGHSLLLSTFCALFSLALLAIMRPQFPTGHTPQDSWPNISSTQQSSQPQRLNSFGPGTLPTHSSSYQILPSIYGTYLSPPGGNQAGLPAPAGLQFNQFTNPSVGPHYTRNLAPPPSNIASQYPNYYPSQWSQIGNPGLSLRLGPGPSFPSSSFALPPSTTRLDGDASTARSSPTTALHSSINTYELLMS